MGEHDLLSGHCGVCLNLAEELWRQKSHQQTALDSRTEWEAVQSAAVGGCKSCKALTNSIAAHLPERKVRYIDLDFHSSSQDNMHHNGPLSVKAFVVEPYIRNDDLQEYVLELYCTPGFSAPWPVIGPAIQEPRLSKSDQCGLLSKNWLASCLKGHEKCSSERGVLPKRVIYVGSPDEDPRLHVSSGEKEEYSILSHCWGGIVPLRTTTSTITDRLRSIPYADLPETFSDALMITRQLGLSYIWIDSLCIIQDDGDDWSQEAALMCDYYANATVTIAADGALNSREGCFRPMTNIGKPLHVEDLEDGSIFVRQAAQTLKWLYHGSHLKNSSTKGTLDSRAWTFQERMLSRRILHFNRFEMWWECCSEDVCECSPKPRTHEYSTASENGAPNYTSFGPGTCNGTLLEWHQIVTEFTQRCITYDTDRLPALSGIAALMSRMRQDDYICGLWKSDMVRDLLWCTSTSDKPSKRHETYYAPSWSWASVTGPVNYKGLETLVRPRSTQALVYADIINISWTPATPNPYGPAKRGASLTVSAPISAAECLINPDGNFQLITNMNSRLKFNPDTQHEPVSVDGAEHEVKTRDKLWILELGGRQGGSGYTVDRMALVLKAVVDGSSVFQRVGYAELCDWVVKVKSEKRLVSII